MRFIRPLFVLASLAALAGVATAAGAPREEPLAFGEVVYDLAGMGPHGNVVSLADMAITRPEAEAAVKEIATEEMGDEENGDAAVALDTPLAKIPGLAEDGELDEDAVLDFAGRVGQRFALVPNEKKVAGFETLADVVDWVVASKDAPILVVAWSPRCPMCKNVYDERMVEILGDTGARLVVLASNAPDNVQHVNDYLEMNDYHWNVIMDGDQRLTNRLGGLRTPHCFLLDSTRHLRYRGSFDNDPRGSKEGDEHKEYLRSAIEAVSNGGQVAPDMTETEPVG